MRSVLICFFCVVLGTCAAQNTPLVFAGGNTSAAVTSPSSVNASDGVYEKFVLVRWEGSERIGDYRVFRASSNNGASMMELTKSWQKSTWFCDYSAEKGKDYYYAVMGSDGKASTPLSKFDKGFVRKEDKTAQDESLSFANPDRYAAAKKLFMLVAELTTDSSHYEAGSTALLEVGLQNIFNEPSPRIDLLVYLSQDATWDLDDTLLVRRVFSSFPPEVKAGLEVQVPMPLKILPGKYQLLVVAAPEGDILNAKTGVITINITSK